MNQVGVIGTGAIGARICARLASAGRPPLAWDISPAALAEAVRRGAQASISAATLAAACETIILCVTDEQAVQAVVQDITPHLCAGSVVIDTTSSHPGVTQRVAGTLKARGVDMLDAPVSRGVPAAENGTLSIMVGGDAPVLERCLPVLRLFGTDIYHVGPAGAGHAVKALNMLLMGVAMTATAEVMAIGQKAGIQAERIVAVLNVSSGRSYATAVHFPRWILPGTYESGFTLGLMAKDVRLGTQIVREAGLPALVTGRLQDLYIAALAAMPSKTDNTRIVPWIEGLAGVTREG